MPRVDVRSAAIRAGNRIDVVQLLRELVRIPSESGQEDALVEHLQATFEALGWRPVRRGRNVYCLFGSSGPMLLLNSHTDTVPVGAGWTRDALAAEVDGEHIFGRGSNDAKGSLAAMIAAVASQVAPPGRYGRICLAATCEEEIAGQGLERLLPELPAPDAAVVGEPTGLQPAVAQRGLVLLELTASGRSAHVAYGDGINAIEVAMRDVAALKALSFPKQHPVLGSTTLHVTQIRGGERHNVIPDRCELVVDIRTTPAYAPEEIVALVEGAVESSVRVRSKRLLPVSTPVEADIVQAALVANPGSQPYGSHTLSDWVFLRDVPTLKVGPGDSRRSHTPDEYITTTELQDGVAYYTRLMDAYFSAALTREGA